MPITVIAAVATNRIIGDNGHLPWRLSDDLRQFKLTTMSKTVVFGRRTWDAIDKPLSGRDVAVLSRNPDYVPKNNARLISIPDELLKEAENKEIVIAGGAEIYKIFIPHADMLYVTHVHATPSGDTLFPIVDWDEWVSISWDPLYKDNLNEYEASFETYVRKK